jgi:hypothetical protein
MCLVKEGTEKVRGKEPSLGLIIVVEKECLDGDIL